MSVTAFRLILYKLRQPEPVKNAGRGGAHHRGSFSSPPTNFFLFRPFPLLCVSNFKRTRICGGLRWTIYVWVMVDTTPVDSFVVGHFCVEKINLNFFLTFVQV